jgi:hypothetical protein
MNLRKTQHWDALVQPFLPWKRINYCIFWVCVCRLWYPSCNAHALYCYLWPDRLYSIFAHYHINGTIFEEKLLNIHCMFWFNIHCMFWFNIHCMFWFNMHCMFWFNIHCMFWFNMHCMFWFSLKYFSFEEELGEICSHMYITLHVQYPLFSSDFNETLIFWTDFGKKTHISNFMEIRPLGAELFHADRHDKVQ